MKIIVGLGNPGKEYSRSRHNVGWLAVDELARRWQIDMSRERFTGWFGDGSISGKKVGLLKPLTFMNRSGRSALAAVQFYKIEAEDFMVVTDDLNLSLGRLRIRKQGSAGGHNGLADLVEKLGTNAFPRLRIGIGGHRGGMVSHVLGNFGADEKDVIEDAVVRAADAVECWISDGMDACMNRFNPAPDTA